MRVREIAHVSRHLDRGRTRGRIDRRHASKEWCPFRPHGRWDERLVREPDDDGFHTRGLGKRALPGERLQEHQPERVHVCRRRRALSAHLLGSKEGRRADDEAGLGESLGPGQVSDSEVGESCPVAFRRTTLSRQQDVRRLHVAMDDAGSVHRGESFRQVEGDSAHFIAGQRATIESFGERHAVDEFHHEIGLAVLRDARVEQRHKAGMIQRRQQCHLAPGTIRRCGILIAQAFDRHRPAELRVFGANDVRHAAASEHTHRPVATTDELTGGEGR